MAERLTSEKPMPRWPSPITRENNDRSILSGFRSPSAVSLFINWSTGRLFRIYLQRAGGDPIPIMFLRSMGAGVLT